MLPKLAPGCDLLLGHSSLLVSQKPRPRLAFHGLSQAVIGTVASLGIISASAASLTAFDGAFGNRATTHRLRLSQLGGELADTGWNFESSSHALSYGILGRKINQKNKVIQRTRIFLTCTPPSIQS
jgi:hypothetical protein